MSLLHYIGSCEHNSPPGDSPADRIIELIYSGNALAKYLVLTSNGLANCVCGVITPQPESPSNHATHCPVRRFYAAVEAMKKAVR